MNKNRIRIQSLLLVILILTFGAFINPIGIKAANIVLVEVGGYSVEGDMLIPGTDTTIALEVRNVSKTTGADNVILTITSKSNYVYPAYGTGNQFYIGHLDGGETKTVEIPVSVSRGLDGENVDLTCSFSYLHDDTRVSNSEVIVIPTTSASPVNIEVVDYSLDSEVLVPGKDTVLQLNVHNMSSTKDADAVYLIISSSTGKVFSNYGTDNQYYIGSIKSNENKSIEIPLSVSNVFDGTGAELVCQFSYTVGTSNGANNVRIMLPATGGTPIVVKTVEIGSTAILNSKSLLSVTLWNNSSSDISDAKLIINGNVSEDSREIKLDTLDPLQNYSEDCQITFTKAGGSGSPGCTCRYIATCRRSAYST